MEAELQYRTENERYRYFEPNGRQEEFIKVVGETDMVAVLSASNSLGKTALVANILAHLIFEPKNKYFDLERIKNWPYPKRIRYVTTSKNVEEMGPFHQEIKKWWPNGGYSCDKAGKPYYSLYRANGWIMDVMTYNQEPSEFEGPTIGMIICDEPPPKNLWATFASRLRMGGLILVLMTPLTEAAWFFDDVIPRHEGHVVYGAMEDACKEHGVRGHLEHKNIENMISEMSPEEVEARAYGRALYLAGLIYKTFDPQVHILKDPAISKPGCPIIQVVDPHSDKPFAVIWAMQDGRGDFYILDEWPNEDFYKMHRCDLKIRDYFNIFKDKEAGWMVTKRIIDRHFADVRNAANKKTLRDELYDEAGLIYEPSYQAVEEIETGILKVRSYLNYDTTQPINNLNKPKLYINPHCHNTIKSLARWARDPKNGKVKEDYKDFNDVIRYLVMADLGSNEPIPNMPAKKRWG